MASRRAFQFQLCWMIMFTLPVVLCQLMNGAMPMLAIQRQEPTAPVAESFAGIIVDELVYATKLDLDRDEKGAPLFVMPVAEQAQSARALSTLFHTIRLPRSTAAPSTLQAAISDPAASLSTRSATMTITVSTTVLVSPTPTTNSVEDRLPSDADEGAAASLQSSIPTPMSPGAQLGVGFGVTFGLLSMAGVVSFYIWRRRRNPSNDIDGDSNRANYRERLAKVFTFRRYRDNKGDPEWSIESAEKVSIVRNMRAQSVSTTSRSDSRGSGRSTKNGAIPITMPKRKMSMALTSHPLTPNYTAFPGPPLVPQASSAKTDKVENDVPKPVSWPL
ncbi:hypothetical protein CC86DRAFT_387316 [Ophiobolus disseminans]|uniref:Mid2 domain-containing protein n=1 Tax=Ophiobolus disseminans TaxID=1469910 RepID=A0A6A6ZHC2_9PLEO|nr:hypothetical protein CC86DRAFT_387316 [Ophiobolus disseminans]